MKSILVIGAGKFGRHLAFQLCEIGNDVMLVDKDEAKIEEFSHKVTTAEIGDYTVRSNLEALGVEDYDYIFVCVGDFRDSLIIVDTLKELGASYVVGKASSLVHEKFLLKNGADKTIYPERECAYSMAVQYSYSTIFDFINLSSDLGIYEISPPESWIGKSVSSINVRKIHNINVMAYKNGERVIPLSTADYVFTPSQHILVMGDKKAIGKIAK